MRYGSVCSGVEAATLAWKRLGWKCVFVSEVEPFPCAVLQERFGASAPVHPLDPADASDEKDRKMREKWLRELEYLKKEGDLPNEGDFTKIGNKYAGKYDLLVGGTPCFVAGTMVLTPSGYVPIETLKVGDDIVSGSGKIQKVEAIGSKMAEVGHFRVLGRPDITCTPNHEWFAIEMKRDCSRKSDTYSKKIPVGDYRKVIASKVRGQYIGRIKIAAVEQPEFPVVFNATKRDIIELAGWYVGDGYTYKSKSKNNTAVVFTLCDSKKIELFNSTFRDKIKFSLSKDGRIIIYSKELALWLENHFGRLSLNKKIPYWLYSSPYKEDFLHGYFVTDGSETKRLYRYTTTSKALAYGIADLLEDACVCFTKVAPTTTIEGRTVNQHDYYNIHKYKNKTIRTKDVKGRIASVARSFKNAGIARVFNITVSEEHSYIAEGLWSANCQDLSVAGKRAGFDGERSSLAIDFVELAYNSKCKWVVWENVPGVYSSNEGRDFATFLSLLTGAEIDVPVGGWDTAGFVCNARRDRYGVSWRTLDAQFTRSTEFPFAVPQRRRRVFVVGYLGDWRRAAEVLLEPECSSWHTPSRFRTREILAGTSGKDLALADGKLRLAGQSGADRHWDASGCNPTLNQCNAGSGTIGASNQELFSQNFNGLVTSLGESGKKCDNEQASAQTLEAHEDQHRRNIVFWNNNDYAEALTCTSDRQFMPDKARLQCVIESEASGASFEINYGCPVEKKLAHTLKVGTAPGTYNGVIENAIGCDMYNHALTGAVSKTLNSAASDADHVPTCITPNGDDLSDTLDASYYKGVGSRNGNERTIICKQDSKYYQWHSHNISAKEITDQVSPTLQAGMGEGGASMTTPLYISEPVCLNDQGGSVMSVEDDGNAGTLRANTHGNEQIVCGAFLGTQGSKAMGIGYSEEHPPTLRAGSEVDLVQTLKIRSGKEGGGKGALVQNNISATLGCGNDQTLFVVHGAQTPISNEDEYANPLGCCNDGLENVISLNNKQFGQVEENIASTLLSTDYKEPQVVCYENHANDSRITESNDVSPLLSSRAGTGGGNLPLVQECYAVDKRNQSLDIEVSNTLNTCTGGDNYGTIMQECYAIDSVHSNSMKSANPNSGFHKGKLPKRLTLPTQILPKKQGGNVIVNAVAIAENIIGRADNQGGNGVGAQEELAYTQNATGVMGVCTKGNGDAFESDVHTSLSASGGGQAGQGYPCARIASTVRRLLPVECERLMGFPDNHTKIAWKGKSADECPDSPRYKAAGNSMCVNVMQWIGEQIERVERKYKNESN